MRDVDVGDFSFGSISCNLLRQDQHHHWTTCWWQGQIHIQGLDGTPVSTGSWIPHRCPGQNTLCLL